MFGSSIWRQSQEPQVEEMGDSLAMLVGLSELAIPLTEALLQLTQGSLTRSAVMYSTSPTSL